MKTSVDAVAGSDPLIEHVVVRGSAAGFRQEASAGQYHFSVDEPANVGGTGSAPDPYDYLLAALGACTSMTVGWYARQRKFPLESVEVSLAHAKIHAKDCADCETKVGLLDRIDLKVKLIGDLTAEQRAKLMEIAAKCPVHKTLKSEIEIRLRAIEQ